MKYENHIITTAPSTPPGFKGAPGLKQMLLVNGEILKGAFHVSCAWISPGPNPGVYEAHVHPHDEIVGFIGTNPEDPSDLGGEAELWIDDENYNITKSFMVYFPKGLKHCPLSVTNVKTPIFHFDIQLAEGRPVFNWIKDPPS